MGVYKMEFLLGYYVTSDLIAKSSAGVNFLTWNFCDLKEIE